MDTYWNPVRTFLETGGIRRLPEILTQVLPERSKILVLGWGESVFEADGVKWMLEQRAMQWETHVFEVSNPDVSDLFQLYSKTKDGGWQCIVAIGGGSTLDVAKSLCCLYGSGVSSEDELRQRLEEKSFRAPECRWIGVPTTAGTGSEVTCWATVWDKKNGRKLSLENRENYAYAAIIDPQLAASMPLALSVSSALDAALHAAEAFWANASNTVSKALALQAVRTVTSNIEGLFDEETRARAQEKMAKGSLLAGLAFSNTKTTACHSLSYPLTLKYNLPHGVAVSLLLAPVARRNQKAVADMQILYEAFQVKNSGALGEKIKTILTAAKIPTRLRDWGAEKSQLRGLAEHSLTAGRIDNNPVRFDIEEIHCILEEIF